MTANQPVKVGGIAGNARRIEFIAWAKAHLSKADVARIEAVAETYRATAYGIGLIAIQGVRVERRMIREMEKERRQKATPATAERGAVPLASSPLPFG